MSKANADKNWEKVRKIFDDALRQTPEERQKFVRQACGRNKTLKAEVESLLSSLDSAKSFLETPAVIKVAGDVLAKDNQFEQGQILGHYEIVEKIGAGGMGEVYLANDTKLNRRVAIKVLRENLLSDEQANRRLLREARAAALLEHPNICAIYEVSESADCSFIVMQYASGETLAELLKKERLSIKLSLDLAIQIADALTEAHEHGIIHRDIKPANIIVNNKNRAKVLDFGLAKFVEAETNSETTQRLKSSGAVMGTVPFMSPEQLRGKRLDGRTDIFSFGVLFYEMLAGRQAFGKENNAETISAILNDEPDFSPIPTKLQPILSKSLMKNRDLRYRTAKDLAEDLRDLQKNGGFDEHLLDVLTSPNKETFTNQPQSQKKQFYFWQSSGKKALEASETTRIGTEQTAGTKTARVYGLALWLSGWAIFLVAVGAGLFFWKSNKTDDSHLFDALRPVRLIWWKVAAGGFYTDYRVSHDGKLIAYSSSQGGGKESIYIKQTTDGEDFRVTKDDWINVSPVWSPNDQRIAYTSRRENQSGIYVCPALGGTAVPLKIIGKGNVFLRHWSKDGTAIFYEYQGNLFRLDLATQEVAQVTDLADASGTERFFSISPDEDKIVFCDKTDGRTEVWIMSINGGEKLALTNDGSEKRRPRWHADGKRILYNVLRGNFQQIGLAYTDGRPPVQVTRGDSQYEMIDVSADGTKIFYFAIENRSDIAGVKTETGEEFEVAAGGEYEYWADVSPDGKSIAFQTTIAPQFHQTSIIVKPVGGNQTPTLRLEGYNPHWLPDSRRISFTRWSEAEQKHLLWMADTANGEEKQLTTFSTFTPSYSFLPKNRGEIGVVDWLPDGRTFVYLNAKSPKNVWMASLDSAEIRNLTNNESADVRYTSPLFSTDGKRVVFISRETISEKMSWSIWLWEEGKTKRIYSSSNCLRLLGWTASGNEILLEMTDGVMKPTPLDVKLMQFELAGENRILTTFKDIYADTMTLSADGKTLAFTARQNDKDDLWTAAATGGEPKKMTSNSNPRLYYASPTWSPDGKTIFFDKQEQIDTISMFENFILE